MPPPGTRRTPTITPSCTTQGRKFSGGKDAVRDEVRDVDEFIGLFMDPNHVVVKDNFHCGFLWLYDYDNQTYDFHELRTVLADQVPVPKPCP
jgi:hypothetical protein